MVNWHEKIRETLFSLIILFIVIIINFMDRRVKVMSTCMIAGKIDRSYDA